MKALKTAALVVGAVALVATGVGAVGGLAIGATAAAGVAGVASTIGISSGVLLAGAAVGAAGLLTALTPTPSAQGTQTKWKADPYAGLPYVIGRTLVSGNIVARRGSGGNNTYQHFVTVLSVAGPIRGIETTFANKTTVRFGADGANGTAIGTYANLLWQTAQLGRQPEPAALQPLAGAFPGWSAQHRLSGMAATLVTMEYDAKGKNQLTTEPQMSWIADGVYVYDPRLDSSYPGGAGTCRAYDEATYVWSDNPHLHALTFAMGRYANGKRIIGIGGGTVVPGGKVESIDVASFVEGANLDEARGWKIGGQIASRPDAPWNSLKQMLQAGGAQPVLIGGSIVSINRAPRVSLATITRDDIVGECSFSGTQPQRARINGIIPSYRSEAHDWQVVPAKAVSVAAYVAVDGGERTKEMTYGLVQEVDHAAQLAAYDIQDAREAGPGTIPLKPWWLNYRVGDCVTFAPEDGFATKVMITSRALEAQSGVVTYDVKTETDAKHAFALGMTGVAPATASIAYSNAVAVPDATDWTAIGATSTANGVSTASIAVTGAVGNGSADAFVVEYCMSSGRLQLEDGSGALLMEDGSAIALEDSAIAPWVAVGLFDAATTQVAIPSVASNAVYDVAISYRVRGVLGGRLVLPRVQAGTNGMARGWHILQQQDVAYPVTATSTAISIVGFSGTLDDGRKIAFSAAQLPVQSATTYQIVWDLIGGAYQAIVAPALDAAANANFVAIRNITTAAADGTTPAADAAPAGDGGSGSGGSARTGRASIQ